MLLLGFMSPALLPAAELYRYVDERGVVVLDRHGVPPQHISRGYQVLNEQGRVVREVPPAPSAEEFARLQAKKARDASSCCGSMRAWRMWSVPRRANWLSSTV